MTNEERVKGLRRHVARGRRDRGQSLIEFALVLPMLLVLFFGIIEFGNAWRIYQLVTNTAREGAREAVLPSSTTATVDAVIDERLDGSGLDASQATDVRRRLAAPDLLVGVAVLHKPPGDVYQAFSGVLDPLHVLDPLRPGSVMVLCPPLSPLPPAADGPTPLGEPDVVELHMR